MGRSILKFHKPKQAVILAGGAGTRLMPLTKYNPKPLIDINGKPFISYLLDVLEKNNFKEVIILTGYQGKKFEKAYEKLNRYKFKLTIFNSPIKFETASRLKVIENYLDDTFFLLYGDNYLDIKFDEIWNELKNSKKKSQMIVYRNDDRYSTSNIDLDKKNNVINYDKTRKNKKLKYVDLGFFILQKNVLKNISANKFNISLQRIIKDLIREKNLHAFITLHKYYSISNLDRFHLTKKYFNNMKSYIFLDRDGVINIKPQKGKYVRNWSEWKWKKNIFKAFSFLKSKSLRVIVVTNQAGISLGKLSLSDLNTIHKKMISEIEANGGEIEDVIFCPHHWDENCFCRKPEPGMLIQAQKLYDLNLPTSLFIGDQNSDESAAKKVNLPFYYLSGRKDLYKLLLEIYDK